MEWDEESEEKTRGWRERVVEWLPKNVTMPKYIVVTNQRFNALYLVLCLFTLAFICWDFFGHEGWSTLTFIRTELFVQLVPEASFDESYFQDDGGFLDATCKKSRSFSATECAEINQLVETDCTSFAQDSSLCFCGTCTIEQASPLEQCCECGGGDPPSRTQGFGAFWEQQSDCCQRTCRWTDGASEDQLPCKTSLSSTISDNWNCSGNPPPFQQLLEFDSKGVAVVTALQTWSWYGDSFTTHRREYNDTVALFRFSHRSTSIEGVTNTFTRLLGDEHERVSSQSDGITILLGPQGLVWQVYENQYVDVKARDLLYVATGSQELPPDGVEIVAQVLCYTDANDLEKSPLLAPDGYKKVGYQPSTDRFVCLMRAAAAQYVGQGTAYKTPGEPEVTRTIGLIVRTTEGIAAAHYLHSNSIFGKLVSIAIILLVPTILLQFLIFFCLGQMSVVFRRAVLSKFDLSKEISALAVRLIVDWVMFNVLAERKKYKLSTINRRRLRDNMQFIFHQMEFQMPETKAANVNRLVKDFSNFVFDHTSEPITLKVDERTSSKPTTMRSTTRGSLRSGGTTGTAVPSLLRSSRSDSQLPPTVTIRSEPEEVVPVPTGDTERYANVTMSADTGMAPQPHERTGEQSENQRATRMSTTVKQTINFEAFAKATTLKSSVLDIGVVTDIFETGRRPPILERLFTPGGTWASFQAATRRAQRTMNPVVWQDGQIMAKGDAGPNRGRTSESDPQARLTGLLGEKEKVNREARTQARMMVQGVRHDKTELEEVKDLQKKNLDKMDTLEERVKEIMESVERLREEFQEDKQWCTAAVEVVIDSQEKDSRGHARAEFAKTKADDAHKCAVEADWLAAQSREATARAVWEADHKMASLEEQLDRLLASE